MQADEMNNRSSLHSILISYFRPRGSLSTGIVSFSEKVEVALVLVNLEFLEHSETCFLLNLSETHSFHRPRYWR